MKQHHLHLPSLINLPARMSLTWWMMLLFIQASPAQSPARWEAGASAGLMNCLSDLGGGSVKEWSLLRDLRPGSSWASAAVYARYRLYSWLSFRFGLMAGRVSASDHAAGRRDPDLSGRFGRNLHFRSPVYESTWGIELSPGTLPNWFPGAQAATPERDAGGGEPLIAPYLFAGLGIWHFDPQARLGDHWIDLQPLRLEGQGFRDPGGRVSEERPYRLTQLNLPVAVGIRTRAGRSVSVAFEAWYRFLFTDHLDDVSGTYIDPVLFDQNLPAPAAAKARRLFDRRTELAGGTAALPGMPRGNAGENDGYLGLLIRCSYRWGD